MVVKARLVEVRREGRHVHVDRGRAGLGGAVALGRGAVLDQWVSELDGFVVRRMDSPEGFVHVGLVSARLAGLDTTETGGGRDVRPVRNGGPVTKVTELTA